METHWAEAVTAIAAVVGAGAAVIQALRPRGKKKRKNSWTSDRPAVPDLPPPPGTDWYSGLGLVDNTWSRPAPAPPPAPTRNSSAARNDWWRTDSLVGPPVHERTGLDQGWSR